MAKRKPALAAPPRTRWEANCLFCGEGLRDEGAAFLDHVAFSRDCRDAYHHWVEELDHDRLGG